MPHYLQNFKKVYDKIVQLIKELISMSKLFNYEHRIIRLKVRRIISLISLPGLLNLGRDYILVRPVNSLINSAQILSYFISDNSFFDIFILAVINFCLVKIQAEFLSIFNYMER